VTWHDVLPSGTGASIECASVSAYVLLLATVNGVLIASWLPTWLPDWPKNSVVYPLTVMSAFVLLVKVAVQSGTPFVSVLTWQVSDPLVWGWVAQAETAIGPVRAMAVAAASLRIISGLMTSV
jgi:hypothetical protein